MYIKVRLLKGFSKLLTYKVPTLWKKELCYHNLNNLIGKIVRVPIRNRESSAWVVQQLDNLEKKENFEIKEVKSIEPFPPDKNYTPFIKRLSQYYQINILHFLRRMRGFLDKPLQTSKQAIQTNSQINQETQNIILTLEQQKIVDFLSKKIIYGTYTPTILHGVTGSGKTEVYKKLICTTIAQKKSVILLLPEVTLALQFEKIMRNQLPKEILIHSFHSATTVKNKKLAWEYLVKKPEFPMLIIGVHIPILLPIANLGFIIIDEEHESGYQEKKHPKVNSKDAAIMRAHENKIPILMGSATPSLSSLYNVKTKNWHFFQLKKRFSGNFPNIKTVYLGDKKVRRNFWISQELEDAISDRLARREQIIIFLNRRGYSFFVQCKGCSFIFICPNCSVSLTLHNCGTLHCHYCEYAIEQPKICPECKKKEFFKKGIGTQQVVSILERIFPYACIGRADLDTTTKKKLWQETMSDFEAGCIDILVGTQTISKGFHFPRVTLVGILWADLNLHFPIYNATETTLQQLIQVAGRAGRNHAKSEVIVQAMDIHKVFDYLNEIDYLKFYSHEIQNRKVLNYPPYMKLSEIELKNTNEHLIEKESQRLTLSLSQTCKKNNLQIDILGPAQPPVSKIKNTYIRKIYLKSNSPQLMGALFTSIDQLTYSSRIFFTPNPLC